MANPNRVSHYENHINELNIEGLDFPVDARRISIFEKHNPQYSINVFTIKKKSKDSRRKRSSGSHMIEFYRVAKSLKPRHVNLLLISENGRSHYVYIKNLSKLLYSQVSRHGSAALILCELCLSTFKTEAIRDEHVNSGQCLRSQVVFPIDKPVLQFEKHERGLPVPAAIYLDTECRLEPIERSVGGGKTIPIQKHVPISYAYKIVTLEPDEQLKEMRFYRGPNAMEHMVASLRKDGAYIYNTYFHKNLPMVMTAADTLAFERATKCHICKKKFKNFRNFQNFDDQSAKAPESKVRDHCHYTARYRGAACNSCNLRYQIGSYLPILIHNLNYDLSLFIRELAKYPDELRVVPYHKEKYVSISQVIKMNDGNRKNLELRFLDSSKFLSAPLSTLASSLDDGDFKILKSIYRKPEDQKLLIRKGVFPYDWFSDESKFDVQEFPKKEDFYNILTSSHVSDADYRHGEAVFKHFKCRNMGEYSDLYLKTDVMLLADVFETFRKLIMEVYELDPCHYLTLPSLSWDAMLKTTGVKLDLITNQELYDFIQRGIKGGITQLNVKEAKANNKWMKDKYNPNEPDVCLDYYDANNLYGKAMCSNLPEKNFEFLDIHDNETEFERVISTPDESDTGYILEVDIVYDSSLHDMHDDLPFCPQKKKPPGGKHEKLLLDFEDKKNYVIHYTYLKQALRNGLRVSKVHRILRFKQSAYLKPFIDKNNALRSATRNQFKKDLWKLFNNATFGKSVERTENRRTVKLTTKWNTADQSISASKLIARPNFHSYSIFSEDFVAIEMKPLKIKLDRPNYIGMVVLDHSRDIMYKFFYDYLKKKFADKLRLIYVDTDAFLFKTEVPDFKDMIRDDLHEHFDTSDYKQRELEQYNFPDVNKKVLGKFKDECNGFPLTHFVGLRPKCYCIEIQEKDKSVSKAKMKGISKHVVKNYGLHPYLNTLRTGDPFMCRMHRISSKLHQITTIELTKVGLTSKDDKRFEIPGTKETLAWGNHRIQNYINQERIDI